MVMAEYSSNKKRVREEESSELALPEVKRIRDDLLGILDESDPDPANQDLYSVMKSFEEEISSGGVGVVVVDLTSDSGESQPELGYLLEASDDELGLPPSSSVSSKDEGIKKDATELIRVDSTDSVDDVRFWGFEQVPSYDSFEFGISGESYNTEYPAFDDGLFEYSTACFDYSDYTSSRLGSMPTE